MWLNGKRIQVGVLSLFLLPVSSRLFAQLKPAPPAPAPDQSASVPGAQPVITVHAFCGDSSPAKGKDPASCDRAITREQFEKLMNALNPGGQPISANGRRNLGQAYTEYLAMESAARKSGLEDTEQFREVLEFTRLRTIADLYQRNLQEKFRNPAPEEIEDYYSQHLSAFEKVKLSRILIPREDASGRRSAEYDSKALATAQSVRARAAQGEDPTQLQKEAYATLSLDSPPPTELGVWRRADFNPQEGEEVFSLKPGEISQVEIEPHSYVIYKVTAREVIPREQAQTEIAREIAQKKVIDAIKAAAEAAGPDFNSQYFGPGMTIVRPQPPAVPTTPPRH